MTDNDRRRLSAAFGLPNDPGGPGRAISNDDLRRVDLMIDKAFSRPARVLVLLVECDGWPLERAAQFVRMTPARARETLQSLRAIAAAADRLEEKERRLQRGLTTAERANPTPVLQKGRPRGRHMRGDQ